MNNYRFLILVLLTAIVFCWITGPAAAQKNPVLPKREEAWNNLRRWLPERVKGDPTFQRYVEIYNAREQALTNGSLIPKKKSPGISQLPH